MRRYTFEGGTAVVTGAASGIGAALAAGLAARGSHLVLLDRDADGLAAVAAAARAVPTGVRVTEHVADLADPAASLAAGEAIATAHPDTTLLINNAGIALAGGFRLGLADAPARRLDPPPAPAAAAPVQPDATMAVPRVPAVEEQHDPDVTLPPPATAASADNARGLSHDASTPASRLA